MPSCTFARLPQQVAVPLRNSQLHGCVWTVFCVVYLVGTSERVLLLSGTLHSVLTSVFLMLEKLPKEPIMAMGRAAAKPREDVVSTV